MVLSSGNSGQTELIERIPCRTVSLIGMSSGVRSMTAAAKSVPITGGCTASGKHGGFQGALAITPMLAIRPAGYMERLCPAWRKKNFVKLAWPSGYEAIRSLILKNTWQSGKGFPRWSRFGKLDFPDWRFFPARFQLHIHNHASRWWVQKTSGFRFSFL